MYFICNIIIIIIINKIPVIINCVIYLFIEKWSRKKKKKSKNVVLKYLSTINNFTDLPFWAVEVVEHHHHPENKKQKKDYCHQSIQPSLN